MNAQPTRNLTRAEQARINGAKSRGPKTAAGKARSSQNARKHGMFSHAFELPTTAHSDFAPTVERYLAETPPRSAADRRRLHRLALLDVQLRHCWDLETTLLQDSIDSLGPLFPGLASTALKALAFSEIHAGLRRLSRIESRIQRSITREIETKNDQTNRTTPFAAAENRPNEPEPAPSTPPAQWHHDSSVDRMTTKPQPPLETLSGIPVKPFYGPLGRALEPPPGEFPYTRGIHQSMYRGRLWTMRQFSGFGTPEETNRRYRYLLDQGQTGLSVAFDLPTLMGYDSDQPQSLGEVGKCGVAISSLEDMETLLDGIPLDRVSVSMTINSPASILWAMYLAVAEKQGVPWDRLNGTLQNDILKEYSAQKEFIYPPRPSMRLVTDSIVFGAQQVPRFNPVSISGYHIREAGSTAVQELAFTLRDGIEYVEDVLARGLDVDAFAPRLSFFFNSHNDFFEEIAKFRAARRMWARIMRDRFGAKDERSWKLRFHAQTAGCSLTWQQPYNNVIRTAMQALAAVLGGCQSLHTNSLDEAYALPSEHAVTIALRTQQILAHESGVTSAPDPLGGSYFVEELTDRVEAEALGYIHRIDEMGGMITALERGFPQQEIADASYRYQKQVEQGERVIVGVNAFQQEAEDPIELLQIDGAAERRQVEKLAALRKRRDAVAVERSIEMLKRGAESDANTMPLIVDCVRAYATVGEICDALRHQFGVWTERARL